MFLSFSYNLVGGKMKKKINIEKRIDFPTMVGEITAISLEKDLKFVSEDEIEGNLILSGKYKLTEASRLEEDFNYKIPISINLMEKLDINTCTIEISNFTYDMQKENIMICTIELLIDGLELLEEENRECDGDIKEIEIPVKEEINKIVQTKETEKETKEENTTIEEKKEVISKEKAMEIADKKIAKTDMNIFNINDDTETYGTLLVYIVKENETINTIITKYKTTVEELEKYNNLKDLTTGTKLIIPLINEES